MSKIARYQGNVRAFASDAQGMERTVFGGTNQADDLSSQITASFLRGWGIVGASEHPSLEDFNAAMYAMSQFIAYQHQMGIAEWHAQQEYHIGSICTHNGESYQSLQDANVGSPPPSAKWTPVLTSKNGLANLGLVIGSDPGNLVTSGSTQPVYKSLLYAQDAKTITQRGYLVNGVIGADTLIKLGAVLAKNNTKNWTLETFIAAYCGQSQDAIDSGTVLGVTDGGNFTYLWKLLNNGSLIGPGGKMASESWANALFLSKTDVKEIGYMQSDKNRPYFKDKDGLFRELQLKNSADLSSTGWRRDTSTGELIQWGIASNVQDDTPAQVTFPIAFPNYCLSFKTSLKRKAQTMNTTAQLSVWGDYNDLGSGTVVFQSNSQDADTRSGDIYWEARGY